MKAIWYNTLKATGVQHFWH